MNLKKTLTALALAASLYLPVKADPPPPQRTIQVDSNNPLTNAESNAKVYFSINESLGKAADTLEKKHSLDKKPLGRLAQWIPLAYTNLATGFYTHELGHHRVGKKSPHYTSKIDFGDWHKSVPNYIGHFKARADNDIYRNIVISGLNQEEIDAHFNHTKTLDSQSFDQAIGFLARKFSMLTYDGYSLNSFDTAKEGDVAWHLDWLNFDGIDMSRKDFYIQAGISSALSTKTWDSLFTNINYLFKGERTRKTTKIKLKDIEITPPLVNLYLTPKGSFFNTATYLKKKNLWEISFGIDDTYIGESKLDRVRAGLKLVNKPISDAERALQRSPFAYTNFSRKHLNPKGYSAGLELFKPITKRLGISAKYEYNKDDVLENTVKGEDNGHNFTIGLEMKL